MIELITGSLITALSLLIGYKLGKDQTIVTQDTRKQINRIFNKVVPNDEVGIIERPTQQDNFYRDNPRARIEDEVMTEVLDAQQG